MNARTKKTMISPKTKLVVYQRDGFCCVLCNSNQAYPDAHYISRSRGGLGIPENIVTLCRICHNRLDQSTERPQLLKKIKDYLDAFYPDFTDEMRKYKGE